MQGLKVDKTEEGYQIDFAPQLWNKIKVFGGALIIGFLLFGFKGVFVICAITVALSMLKFRVSVREEVHAIPEPHGETVVEEPGFEPHPPD